MARTHDLLILSPIKGSNLLCAMDDSQFLTASLRSLPWGRSVTRTLAATINAVEPGEAINRYLKGETGLNFRESGSFLSIGAKAFPLPRNRKVTIVGAGKAGAPMVEAAVHALGEKNVRGVVIVKEGYAGSLDEVGEVSILEAGHPIPDERGVRAAEKVVELLQACQPEDLVLCLLSGGGSALLISPVDGVSLQDLQALTGLLLGCGASIDEINTLRKHLEKLKGGRLVHLAHPAQVAALILSDVVGDPLEVIASGPTVPDPTTFEDALAILDRYNLLDQVPIPIRQHLFYGRDGLVPETPKPGDPVFEKVQNMIVGSNALAAEAALERAQREGFKGMLLTTFLQGEAREAGRLLGALARQIAADGRPLPRPACIVLGGETTVTLKEPGKGGRNQELALGAVGDLDGIPNIALVTLATDGGDGPTDAAGAVVTGETLQRARQFSMDPWVYLKHNDAYSFFEPLGDLIKTGPTQTNVNDLAFIFAY
jgi:hydroxypyruvate reductase